MRNADSDFENSARELFVFHVNQANKYKKVLSILLQEKISEQSKQFKDAVKIHRKLFK